MFAVIAAKQYPRRVPFTYRCEDLACVRRDEIVQSAGAVGGSLVVLVKTIVEHLILETQCRVVGSVGHRDLFRHVVLHTAVSRSTDLPFPCELEIAKGVAGHEIAAGRRLAVWHSGNLTVREFTDRAVLDLPVRGGN